MNFVTSSLLFVSLMGSALSVPVTFDRRQDRQYPTQNQVPDTSMTPQTWTDSFNAAKCELDGFFLPCVPSLLSLLLTHLTSNLSPHEAAGKIPDFPLSTNNNGYISYPGDVGSDPGLCSWTVSKCYGPHDIYNAPTNVIGISESTALKGLLQKGNHLLIVSTSLLSQALTMDQLEPRLIFTTFWIQMNKAALIF